MMKPDWAEVKLRFFASFVPIFIDPEDPELAHGPPLNPEPLNL
jgi:hypothetical protein